jgi:hypothetical protein
MKTIVMCIAFVVCSVSTVSAQETTTPTSQSSTEQTVALTQKTVALDASGREALTGSLLTGSLQGTPEAPLKNVRFVVENRGAVFYTYVSGAITFYKEGGVRCGEGLFALSALAPGEAVETDAPGLRLECSPVAWRLVATNLLTRANESSGQAAAAAETQPQATSQTVQQPSAPSPLYLTIDGQQYQVPLNSTLEIPVKKRRIKITLSDQP